MKVNQTNNKAEILDAYNKLETENSQLLSMLQKLSDRLDSLESQPTSPVAIATPTTSSENRMIKIVSLYNGTLNLATRADGMGKTLKFLGMGQDRHVNTAELHDIVHNNYRFFEKGYAYIDDADFVKSIGLLDVYATLLDGETMINLINMGIVPMSNMFSSATKEQQENIAGLIATKLSKGENVDLNKVYKLSEIYGKDIAEMAKDMKFLNLDTK
jgi:hypothetical protein